jgi:hypothetical protein
MYDSNQRASVLENSSLCALICRSLDLIRLLLSLVPSPTEPASTHTPLCLCARDLAN